MRTAKSTSVGTTKSARTNKSANVHTNKSVNVGTSKSACIDTINSANVVTKKAARVGTIKSANVGTNMSAKANKTTERGKEQKTPVWQRKSGTVRKGKRGVSTRNAKKTMTNTKPNRASRSLGKERVKKGVNGKSVTASEKVSGEQHKHVNDDTDLSEDNSEDTAPLADTESSQKQNGEETDSDSIRSSKNDEQLTHEKTVSFAGSDSDTQDVDHESNMHTVKTIGTGPHELDEVTGSAMGAGNDSSSGSERSYTPLSNYIARSAGKGCKITIKKTSNGFISGDECGMNSQKHRQSDAKTRKSAVTESTVVTAIVSDIVNDYKTDGPTVDDDVVSQIKSGTNIDVVIVHVCTTGDAVVDSASCCKADSSTKICDVASRFKTDNDTDVPDMVSRCEADAPVVDDAMSDDETGGSGELTIAEPEHNEDREPETDALAPVKIDICADVSVVFTDEAALICSRHSKDTDAVLLLADENDQSFAKAERENQEIDTAEKSPSELLAPSDDDTEVRNNNVTSPAAHEEPIRLVYDWVPLFLLNDAFLQHSFI